MDTLATIHATSPLLFLSKQERLLVLYNIGRLNVYLAADIALLVKDAPHVKDLVRDITTAAHMQLSLATAGGVTAREIKWLAATLAANGLSSEVTERELMVLCNNMLVEQ